MKSLFIILPFLFGCSGIAQPEIKLAVVAEDLMGPVAMACPDDGSKRIFICEQTGKIRIVKDGKMLSEPFLDVSKKLDDMGKILTEKGLLGIAFHPKFKLNGKFYIYYTAPEKDKNFDHRNILEAYRVSDNPDIANPDPLLQILELDHPAVNHNSGQLQFGPDGYLYVSIGDGGGAGDKHGPIGNAQNLESLHGKILRINVDSGNPYSIPPDNPFVNIKNARPEIWAYGLRNPWRFSFDRKNGTLFCGDVGQSKYEEVDIIEKGKNYGWRIMEGEHCYEPEKNCSSEGLTSPIAEYGHNLGKSITGGYMYRGKNATALYGKYIFADWKGKMFFLEEKNGKWEKNPLKIDGKKDNDLDNDINSFGEDTEGEIYVLAQKITGHFTSNGILYRIEAK